MKKIATLAWGLCLTLTTYAQTPFKCKLYDKENRINLVINLYEESVPVPGLDMFGPLNGYMNGNIYGIWMITSCKVKNEKEATIRLSNELGSENQEIELSVENDSIFRAKLKDGVSVKKVINKKLVKIPKELIFKKTADL